MMEAFAKLIGFALVIPDSYTFVQPIFEIGDKVALQIEDNGIVVSWRLFDFDESVIKITSKNDFSVSIGSKAICGFQPAEGVVWFGCIEVLAGKIKNEWLAQSIHMKKDAGTLATVRDFIRTVSPSNDYLPNQNGERVIVCHEGLGGMWFLATVSGSNSSESNAQKTYSTQGVVKKIKTTFRDKYRLNSLNPPAVKFAVPLIASELEIRAKFEKLGAVESVKFSLIKYDGGKKNHGLFIQSRGTHHVVRNIDRSRHNFVLKLCTVVMRDPKSALEARDLGNLLHAIGPLGSNRMNITGIQKLPIERNNSHCRNYRGRISGSRSGNAKK